MNKQGYVIAKNSTETAFFTSSSAYDNPQWTPMSEATVYPTAELANSAMLKLIKNGTYSAKIVEASMQFEFPDEGPNKNQAPITQTDDELEDDQLNGENPEEGGMVAGQLDNENPEDELNIEDDDIEMGDEFDQPEDEFAQEDSDLALDDEDELGGEENEQAFLSPTEQQMMQGKLPRRVGEGLETNVEKIKFAQDSREEGEADFSNDIDSLHKDFKIPANVLRALKASIKTYDDAASFNNGRDDAKASMALTIVDALRTIEDCLKQGTHEGVKQAQIKITTFMNPITTNFPPEVLDFLYKSGRQPTSLKNMFYDKWDSRDKSE